MVNRVYLLGNLGADPEVRETGSGVAVATMRLATSSRVKRDGEWTEETEWHRVVAFARTAEVMRDYAHKGKRLHIEGRIKTREWTDKEGQKRWTTEIVAERIQLLGSKGESQGQSHRRPSPSAGAPMGAAEDIPF